MDKLAKEKMLVEIRDIIKCCDEANVTIDNFESAKELAPRQSDDFVWKVLEVARSDGNLVDWNYWLDLPKLTYQEATYLIHSIDPNDSEPFMPNYHVYKCRTSVINLKRKLNRLGILEGSPYYWAEWARKNWKEKLPPELHNLESSSGKQISPEPYNAPLEHWKMKVQAEAAIRWKEQRKQGCNPTPHSLKDELAKWCRDENVRTKSNINPTPEYLYRHVLSSKHWTPPTD